MARYSRQGKSFDVSKSGDLVYIENVELTGDDVVLGSNGRDPAETEQIRLIDLSSCGCARYEM